MAHTVRPSIVLQSTASSIMSDIIHVFSKVRENADIKFHEKLAAEIGADAISIPRQAGRQCHRSNVQAGSPKEYYRRTVFTPFVDFMISLLKSRFGDKDLGQVLFLRELLKKVEATRDGEAVLQQSRPGISRARRDRSLAVSLKTTSNCDGSSITRVCQRKPLPQHCRPPQNSGNPLRFQRFGGTELQHPLKTEDVCTCATPWARSA